MNVSPRRLAAASALTLVASLAAAGPLSLGQRELSGRDNRFIEIPQGHANAGFRAVSPGKRIAFDEGGVQMNLKSPRLEKGTNGTAALRYSFEGGARVAPKGVNASPTVYHWFVGERSQWLTNLKSYGAIAYRGVWPGVDAVFAGDAGGFKYQFELAAGAKPGTVALVVEGADSVRVTEAGALEWTIGGEKVIDDAPLAFQPSGTEFATVAAAYEVRPLGNGRWRIGFAIGDHDASKALIIDPAWTGYSGLVGGSAQDQVYAVSRDALANTYACGVTASTNMPSIPPGTVNAGGDDAFFVKFDSAGVAQVVAYVGGGGADICNGIAVDSGGRIYLAGGTTSTNFPAVGTDGTSRFRRTKAGDRDAFVMRFVAAGNAIEYSGFIGGAEDDQANAVAVDSSNRAYVTGFSACTDTPDAGCVSATPAFPALGGPRTTRGTYSAGTAGMDSFVARIDASGGTLEYAGFIGGDGGAEMGNGIAVGADFSAYVAGATDSATGLASPGGFRTTVNARPADASDGFVAKVAPTGESLSYFTLLTGTAPAGGESGADRALAIALESDGTVIVAGETDSQNFPANESGTRVGSGPQTASGGGMDGFVLRLNATGAAIDAATYLGGPGHDSAEGVASDGTSLFVTGTTTNGTGFPTALQSGLTITPPGGQDAFLSKIARGSPATFVYSGFLGTTASETLRAIAVSVVGGHAIVSAGGATTTAGTSGLTNPTTGALGTSGSVNGLVLRIDPVGPPASITVQSGSPQSAPINTAFATALSVLVRDVDLQPVAGVTVTFTPPASGASASLSPAATAVTNASGIASVSATANGIAGSYAVSAQVGAFSADFSLTNLKGDQTITFAALSDRTMLETPFTVSATATSTLTVAFSSTTTAVCTVSGTSVTLVSAGTCEIAADQAGDANYNAAPQVKRSFQVTQASQTIDFASLADRTMSQTPFTVSATATSGLTVSFSSLTTPVCTVSGTSVTLVSAGLCTIAADQAGNATYAAAPQVTRSFNVTNVSQTIAFGPLAGKTFGDAPFGVSATATSGLPVTFSSLTLPVCTVADSTVTIVAAGPCTIAADQAGDATYGPAPRVTQSFTVAKAAQAIAFGTLSPRTFGDASFSVSATGGGSGNPVLFSSLTGGTCGVSGTTVTILGAGNCTLAANQAGSANFEPAAQVTQSFAIAPATQSISFAALPTRTMADGPFTASATATSGLAVVFGSATPSVCSVSGDSVTPVAPGVCTVTADQPGDANRAPATQVSQSFYLLAADPGADSDGDGIPDPVEIAEGRHPFVKDNDVFSPGAASARLFAMQQYRDLLGSEGDPAGIQGWGDLVVAGAYSRPQVIDAFMASPEFDGFMAPVVRLYFAAFGRAPDYAGLMFNTGLVRTGTLTIAQLAEFFAASPEFLATYGVLDNTQFVTRLYQDVLGRAPDPAGLAGWVFALDSGGASRGFVLRGFSDSFEYKAAAANRLLVSTMYTNLLRRTPDAPGFGAWLSLLDGGMARTQVIDGFYLSAEYRARLLP